MCQHSLLYSPYLNCLDEGMRTAARESVCLELVSRRTTNPSVQDLEEPHRGTLTVRLEMQQPSTSRQLHVLGNDTTYRSRSKARVGLTRQSMLIFRGFLMRIFGLIKSARLK